MNSPTSEPKSKFTFPSSAKMVTIIGPTASGKTELAAHLAYELDAEIISGDSRQVYRRMDIGTGKDLADYVVCGKNIPYHLIDIVEPGTQYNLFRYQEDFYMAYQDICSRGHAVVLCGGTGLYVESVLRGYSLSPVPQNNELRKQLEGKTLDELTAMLAALKAQNGAQLHNTTDVDSCQRAIRAIEIEQYQLQHRVPLRTVPAIDSLIVGVQIDREHRREKITKRLKARLEGGLVEEIRGLLDCGVTPDELIYYGLEYKYVTEYVMGKLSYDDMFQHLEIAIHQFAKRQMTWFRGMERRGMQIHWIDAMRPMEEKLADIKRMLVENV